MKNGKVIAVMAIFLSACATTANYEKVLSSWVGSNVDNLVSSWGHQQVPTRFRMAAKFFNTQTNAIFRLVATALWLIPAFKGNKWREENVSKRGYEQLSTVQAETPEAAVAQMSKSSANPADRLFCARQ